MTVKRVVVVPAHGRELEIGTLCVLLRRLGEVVVIDNGSGDDTAEVAGALGAGVIRLKERQGWRYLLRRIKRLVREGGYKEVIIYDPKDRAEVTHLTEAASRFGGGGIIRFKVPESHEGERGPFYFGTWMMSRDALLSMRLKGLRISPEREIMHYARKYSIPTGEVEVERIRYRKRKAEAKRPPATLRDLFRGGRSFVRNHPLTFWGSLGVVALFFGLFMGTLTVNHFYTHHRLHYYYAFLTFVLVFLSGVLLFTGLILNAFTTLRERVDAFMRGV